MTDTPASQLTPRFAQGDVMRVIGLGERYTGSTMDRIPEQWERLQQRLGEVQGRVDPAQFGLHYPISKSPLAFDYVTGVMVDEEAPLPAEFVERRPPVRRVAVFTHRGHISGLRPLLHAIFSDWLPGSGHDVAHDPLFTEVYSEDFDPVQKRGVIEVRVSLQD